LLGAQCRFETLNNDLDVGAWVHRHDGPGVFWSETTLSSCLVQNLMDDTTEDGARIVPVLEIK